MRRAAFLWVCTWTAVMVVTSARPHNIQTRSRLKLCGKHLAEALSLVCNNNYYSPYKRTNDLVSYGQGSRWHDLPKSGGAGDQKTEDTFPDGQSAVSLMGTRGGNAFLRPSRGVNDECCKKSCSMRELTSYCFGIKRSL